MDDIIRILIIEGPAGSGKTTLINYLKGLGPTEYFFRTVPLPNALKTARRAYTGTSFDLGTHDALVKDSARVIKTAELIYLATQADKNEPSLLNLYDGTIYIWDRFLLSSIVYGNLRASNLPVGGVAHRETRAIMSSIFFIRSLIFQYLSRNPLNNSGLILSDDYAVRILFLLNMPAVEVIEARRAQLDREFPYNASAELERYKQVQSLFNSRIKDRHLIDERSSISLVEYDGINPETAVEKIYRWAKELDDES